MSKTNTISCRQVGILASLMLLVLKFTSLPSLMYGAGEFGGFFGIIIICIFNLGIMALIVWVKKKYKNKNLYEIFKLYLGTILTKMLYFVLFVFFIFKLLSLVDEGFGFIRDIVDEEFTYFNFIICFFPVAISLAYSGIRNLSRTAEFFFPFVLIGLFISLVFSLAPLNFFGLGSLSRFNFGEFFITMQKVSFWSGDIFAILIFIDRIDLNKGNVKNIFSPLILTSIFLISTYFMFYSLYQETSILHSNMLFDIVEYSIGTSSGWHMDIFAIIVYMICLFLQGGIYTYCCVKTVERVFNFNNQYVIYTALIFLLVSVQYLYLNDYLKYIIFAINRLSIFSSILLTLVPILLIIAITINKKSKSRKQQLKS